MIEGYPAHRNSRTSVALFYVILILVTAVYYLSLAMDGSLDLFKPLGFLDQGMAFNSMLEHLRRGEFDVDPAAIGYEGVPRNGKTYTYFGVVPALLRLPLLLTGALTRLDVTRLYCALAATIALCSKLATVALINDKLPKSRLQAVGYFVIVLSLILAGAQIQFLKASIFQETILWAGAIAAAFVYCAVRGLIAKREFSTGLIAVMAGLAGLALLTRVSTALGLYVATGLLLFALASGGPPRSRPRRFVRGLASKRTVVALTILLGFVTLCGIVNYQRWGDPLKFSDAYTIGYIRADHGRLARLEVYGAFNIERLWYAALYYFFPIWTIIRPDGQFLFSEFERRMLDGVEPPPSSFLLSDPLLLVLGLVFLFQLSRLARERLLDLRAITALTIAFSIPVFLILTFCNMAFRYRMEFYPLLEFTAFLGFYATGVNPGRFSALSRGSLSLILIACAGFGIIYSHFALFLYKISPFTNWVSAPDGWVDLYITQLKLIFPSIAEKLRL
jgi:hypothetical protein